MPRTRDFLAKSAIRQIEARNKRQLTAKTVESLRQLTAIARSWLRDVHGRVRGRARSGGQRRRQRASIEEAAARTDAARAAAALGGRAPLRRGHLV